MCEIFSVACCVSLLNYTSAGSAASDLRKAKKYSSTLAVSWGCHPLIVVRAETCSIYGANWSVLTS